ncbi:hypothetical protein GW758_01230 [Candidatus Falkowbacteria bacterium]|nr:hypothetical protein [Candidatus Falkowbacteria bacterium]NCT54564.1 hypothetical protein [Candidatus Falkowbacteria bacterium]
MKAKTKKTSLKKNGATHVDLINKIESAALVGRGGAGYPVAWKWKAVEEALKSEKEAYIVVNGAEGEPGVKKDAFILEKHPEDFIFGLNLAFEFLGKNKVKKIYLFLNKTYIKSSANKIRKILADKKYSDLEKKVEFFSKPLDAGYIGGEESSMLNIIEGKKGEPRIRPPFPTTSGLFSKPTLINNVETFFDVALVAKDEYRGDRFYTISGAIKKPGVYRFPALMPIENVLKQSANYPNFDFFVQIGGNASGEILNKEQINVPADSAASIMVYDKNKTDEKKLIEYWLKFYFNNSCGQCLTCREGTYRLYEMIKAKTYDQKIFWDIVSALDDSSFCALGSSLPIPLLSYYRNIKGVEKV